jgi:hypothetical protein
VSIDEQLELAARDVDRAGHVGRGKGVGLAHVDDRHVARAALDAPAQLRDRHERDRARGVVDQL